MLMGLLQHSVFYNADDAEPGIRPVQHAVAQGRAQDPLVIPPSGNFLQPPMGLAGEPEIEVAHQPDFLVQVGVVEPGENGLAQPQRLSRLTRRQGRIIPPL